MVVGCLVERFVLTLFSPTLLSSLRAMPLRCVAKMVAV
jgi:hypothetical protein